MAKLHVDQAEIERQAASERTAGRESLALLVTMPGSVPELLARKVRRALSDVPGVVRTYPTTFGCYVFLGEVSACPVVVEMLSASLSAEELPAGVEVGLTAPRRPAHNWWAAMCESQRPRPSAFMAFRLTPTLHDWDRAPSGIPYAGWGAARDVTQRLIEHAGPWVSAFGGEGVVFDGPRSIALVRDDVVGVMSRMTQGSSPYFETSFPGTTLDDGGRQVSLDYWGQAAYVEAGSGLDNAVVAGQMAGALRHHAEHLDVAAVRPALAGRTRNFGYAEPRWLENRHLWATRVHQPNAIQLLTSAHLDLAHDLSSWSVEKVAEDRWLVTTADVNPWFDHAGDEDAQNVPTEVMQSAVRDFGDMLLTAEVAATHPLPPPTVG